MFSLLDQIWLYYDHLDEMQTTESDESMYSTLSLHSWNIKNLAFFGFDLIWFDLRNHSILLPFAREMWLPLEK